MPSITRIPGWIDKALDLIKGTREAARDTPRLQRMYEELPALPRYLSPRAVSRSLTLSEPGQVVALSPDQFLSLAAHLPKEVAAPYVDHYSDLITHGKWVEPSPGLFMEHYLQGRRNTPFEGFEETPWLRYMQHPSDPSIGQITGHEGRHRFYTLQQLDPTLQLPTRISELGHPLPALPREVYPESGNTPTPLDLSKAKRYDRGGLVKGALQLIARTLSPGSQEAREALHMPPLPRAQAKQLTPNDFNRRVIASEMFGEADISPTTLLSTPEGRLAAAYQMSQDPSGTSLHYLLSHLPGAGSQALEHAYQSAPTRPVTLHAIPGSEGFYRKQPGWEEVVEDGISKFIRRKQGGLV